MWALWAKWSQASTVQPLSYSAALLMVSHERLYVIMPLYMSILCYAAAEEHTLLPWLLAWNVGCVTTKLHQYRNCDLVGKDFSLSRSNGEVTSKGCLSSAHRRPSHPSSRRVEHSTSWWLPGIPVTMVTISCAGRGCGQIITTAPTIWYGELIIINWIFQ